MPEQQLLLECSLRAPLGQPGAAGRSLSPLFSLRSLGTACLGTAHQRVSAQPMRLSPPALRSAAPGLCPLGRQASWRPSASRASGCHLLRDTAWGQATRACSASWCKGQAIWAPKLERAAGTAETPGVPRGHLVPMATLSPWPPRPRGHLVSCVHLVLLRGAAGQAGTVWSHGSSQLICSCGLSPPLGSRVSPVPQAGDEDCLRWGCGCGHTRSLGGGRAAGGIGRGPHGSVRSGHVGPADARGPSAGAPAECRPPRS